MPVAQTKKAAAVAGANALIALAAQFESLRSQAAELVKQYNSEGWGTTWAALATAALSADGALGTADGSPTSGHPIDTRVTDQSALQRAATATQLTAGVTFLGDYANFLGNAAVGTSQRSQTLDDLVS